MSKDTFNGSTNGYSMMDIRLVPLNILYAGY